MFALENVGDINAEESKNKEKKINAQHITILQYFPYWEQKQWQFTWKCPSCAKFD